MPRSEPESITLAPVKMQIGDIIPYVGMTDAKWLNPRLSAVDRRIALLRIGFASRSVMADSDRSGWFCLCVRSGKEKSVHDVLNQVDVNCFLPVTAAYEYASRGRMKMMPERPVMSGYVLFECGVDYRAFMGVEAIDNVIGVLGGVKTPMLIKEEKISLFKDYLAQDSSEKEPEQRPSKTIEKGDRVIIAVGPFADLVGTVVKATRSKVVVLFSEGGTECEVEHPLAYVRKL